jgi:ferrochelatase
MNKKAVLLINLGTPDHADSHSVRNYLREFLNDPRVIDLPKWLRWSLVNLWIIPFRYKKTTNAYKQIWNVAGSPLLKYSREMQAALSANLGPQYTVELGMRYGHPSIDAALDNLKQFDSLDVIPLFPQYSSAATGSALEKILEPLSKRWNVPTIKVIHDFYNHPGFINAYAEKIKNTLGDKQIDLLVFSYHGLPERHIIKSECKAQCDRLHACPLVNNDNLFCYRAQCYATSQFIAKELNLTNDDYAVAFQSRLGRTPWIKPYTDLLLPELRRKGLKRIAMVSPSFTADCLETLEEINIRTRKQWLALGGTEFSFIPCINADPQWIAALADMVISKS